MLKETRARVARGATALCGTGSGSHVLRRALVSHVLCAMIAIAASASLAFGAEAANDSDSPIAGYGDGAYTIEVTMTGGSGKATVESPAALEIKDGMPFATLVWSSEHYDYMLVNGEKILPTTTDPTSQFRVPIFEFDKPYEMVGDTTAMGASHEITYTFTFDSSSIKENPDAQKNDSGASSDEQAGKALDKDQIMLAVTVGSGAVAAIAIGLTIGILRGYRQRR